MIWEISATFDEFLSYLSGGKRLTPPEIDRTKLGPEPKPAQRTNPFKRKKPEPEPKPVPVPVLKTCPVCGRPVARGGRYLYCSDECAQKVRRRRLREYAASRRKPRQPHPCPECGTPTLKPKYCCPDCYTAARRLYQKVYRTEHGYGRKEGGQ